MARNDEKVGTIAFLQISAVFATHQGVEAEEFSEKGPFIHLKNYLFRS